MTSMFPRVYLVSSVIGRVIPCATLSKKTKGNTRLSQLQGRTPAVRTRGKQQPEVYRTREIFQLDSCSPKKPCSIPCPQMGLFFKRFTTKYIFTKFTATFYCGECLGLLCKNSILFSQARRCEKAENKTIE